jgi:redox-sensitive bicupin YhaK (pirin superfamily)
MPDNVLPDVDLILLPRTTDLGGGFQVRRALPSAQRRMVGPFVFFDEMGPTLFGPGRGVDVRPHPHIGLATVTYLFGGELMHRDSLRNVQPIRPGEVNWMTAGRGIVHSERTPAQLRAAESRLFGIQVWVALPKQHEETEPSFTHVDAPALPSLEAEGARLRVIVGALQGARSPVPTYSEMFYVEAVLDPGARIVLPAEHVERAAYVVEGPVAVGNGAPPCEARRLLVFKPGADIVLTAQASPARLMLFGGEPMDGPRHLWWNFVSSSRDRIEQAKADWQAGRFAPVPDETEFIPLPDTPERATK